MIDFRRVACDYDVFRPRYPAELLSHIKRLGFKTKRHAVLDIGTGAGNLACTLAHATKHIVATDIAPEMVSLAATNLQRLNKKRAEALVARAESLPFREESFDWVFAGQCWHLLDRTAALPEVSRVLARHGRFAIIYLSRLELSGNIVEVTHEIVRRHNPTWTHGGTDGLYPEFLREVQEAGFDCISTFSSDHLLRYSCSEWIGRIKASKGVGACMSVTQVEALLDDLRRELERRSFDYPIDIPHRLFGIVARNARTGSQ